MSISKCLRAAKFNNSRNGSALVFIIIVLLIVAIFSSSILFMFNSNLRQAKHQQDSMEAYYLAYSGVEMAFSAITANSNALIEDLIDGTESSLNENDIDYGEGYIDIEVVKSTDANFEDWIKITSTGTLKRNNHSYTRTMYVNPSNINDFVWINN